ncbi:MAG: NAD-dependent DNA ligase LigA [Phycisphaerae bacterium]
MPDHAQRIQDLRNEIRRHDRLYYVHAQPEISDREYDLLLKQLQQLEQAHPELITADSPTQRVGGQPLEGFETVVHEAPMLSIDNTYNRQQLEEFDARVRKALADSAGEEFTYLVDPKIDGVAASLTYTGGVLTLAATRGDGRRGDDITANARRIRSIPLKLTGPDVPDLIDIRGEIYWPRSTFSDVNAERTAQDLPAFANPRNGAAGTLKSLDSEVVARRQLAFLAHGFGRIEGISVRTAAELQEKLRAWSVPVSPFSQVCDTLETAWAAVQEWLQKRNDVDYETVGMVIKVNELALREQLGTTSRYPRWCIAYKYEAERAETVIHRIDLQVGRLGTITPVAKFDPVQLAGTTVTNASLHNFDQVERLDVRQGDTVLVEKAGEIIPQVVQVLHDKRPAETEAFPTPTECPACGGEVARDEGGVYLRCINPECPAQIRERLRFFSGRDQMDIDHLGPALIDQLVDKGMVGNFSDLYRLSAEDLIPLDRMAEKSAANVVEAIRRTRDRGLTRVLAALGIRYVGGRAAEVLSEHFADIDAISAASVEQLQEVNEIGPAIAESLHTFLHSDKGWKTVDQLRQVGVDMTSHHTGPEDKPQTPLSGKTVVVTGTLEYFSRKEIQEAIKQAGGKASGSVSSKTDYVVVGAKAGSKADRARSLGVPILSEEQFRELLSGGSTPSGGPADTDTNRSPGGQLGFGFQP